MRLPIHIKQCVKGYFRLVVTHEDGTKEDTGYFPNLITNQGLDFIGSSGVGGVGNNTGPSFTYAGVGTGATTPAITDTQLTTQLATQQFPSSAAFPSVTYVAGPPPYWTGILQATFGLGAVIGNIAEVGTGRLSGPTLLTYSHALILDSLGHPTTISLGATDTLQVFYELRMYLQTVDTSYSFVMNSVTYSGVWRTADITNPPDRYNYVALNTDATRDIKLTGYNGTIGATTSVPSGTSGQITNSGGQITKGVYTNGTYYISMVCLAPTGSINLSGGITALMLSYGMGKFQFSVSPAIPKTNVYTLELDINVSWAVY